FSPLWPPSHELIPAGALALAVAAVVGIRVVKRWTFPQRATRTLVDIGVATAERGPRLVRVQRNGTSWNLAWRMPAGVSLSTLLRRRDQIEEALDVSAEFWYERGLVHMRAATGHLPREVRFYDFYRPSARERPGHL